MLVEPCLDLGGDRQQPCRDMSVGWSTHHPELDHRQRAADRTVDDTDAAASQTGVNAQHTHQAAPPGQSKARRFSERMFDRLAVCAYARRVDAPKLPGSAEAAREVLALRRAGVP